MYVIHQTDDFTRMYTLVARKSDALEYVRKYFIAKHIQHFKSWCQIHNKKINDSSVEFEYVNLLDEDELNSISISKAYYRKDDIASICRVALDAVPVGASYETEAEWEDFLDKHPDIKELSSKQDKNID